MAEKTGIQWTDATWNPVTGCTKVSAGCDHCYAETLALRLQRMGIGRYRDGFAVRTHESALRLPLRWKAPRRVFTNSMSDLFHADIPTAFLDRVFAVMALTPQHTYQVLTKRPQRAANYLNDPARRERLRDAIRCTDMPGGVTSGNRHIWDQWARYSRGDDSTLVPWPLPNVWLGTSVEDARVTHRIDALVRCPAVVRFLSCEPLLGPLDLSSYLFQGGGGIDWVIVGGESGLDYRPLDLDWARDIRDQCELWGVPYFFKQVGGLTPKSGGDLLDGQRYQEFPSVALPVAQ